ncbi:MAG: hypothetical protein RL042_1525, partial [Nitrospirota bacterium]
MAAVARKPSIGKSCSLRDGLLNVRGGLLKLHKTLILAEQVTYERIHGRIASSSQLLQLVLNDPWFTWLHPLSQLVVRIDALLDNDELSSVDVEHVLIEVRTLLRPTEEGMTFPQFRGHLVKLLPSSLHTRLGSDSQGLSGGAADYRTP